MMEDISQNPNPVANDPHLQPPLTDPSVNPVTQNSTQGTDPDLSGVVHPEDLDIKWSRWKCLVCGYVYEGNKPIAKCPRCGNEDPDKFEDVE
jgi:hypothetical protein